MEVLKALLYNYDDAACLCWFSKLICDLLPVYLGPQATCLHHTGKNAYLPFQISPLGGRTSAT